MTNKEMTEIFSVMLLAWPNAETFRGGISKLGPTIKLWAACTQEIDFWTGQQAVTRLVKTCKFPPSIAEFREQAEAVQAAIKGEARQLVDRIRLHNALGQSDEAYYASLQDGSFDKAVIARLGGPSNLTTGRLWNIEGIEAACRAVIQDRPAMVGGLPAALPGK